MSAYKRPLEQIASDHCQVSLMHLWNRSKRSQCGPNAFGLDKNNLAIRLARHAPQPPALHEPDRSESGRRLYSRDDQKRLGFILPYRELGFSIAELYGLLDSEDYTCADVLAVSSQHIENIARKIADLKRLKRTLDRISAECSGDAVPDCPFVEALFE